jgi:membrane-associated phospholipid phosphatase
MPNSIVWGKRWGIIVAIAFVLAAIIGLAFWLDPMAESWMQAHQNHALRIFARNVSHFGNWPEHFALGAVLAAVAWWRGSKKWTRIFLSMLIALAIAGLAGRVIKISTGRARPSVQSSEMWNGPELSSKYHSFPSGHVVASTAFFAVLFLANSRIGLACSPIPIAIGFSRIYVGAHYLSDVTCAALIGILSAIVVTRFMLGGEIENQNSRY